MRSFDAPCLRTTERRRGRHSRVPPLLLAALLVAASLALPSRVAAVDPLWSTLSGTITVTQHETKAYVDDPAGQAGEFTYRTTFDVALEYMPDLSTPDYMRWRQPQAPFHQEYHWRQTSYGGDCSVASYALTTADGDVSGTTSSYGDMFRLDQLGGAGGARLSIGTSDFVNREFIQCGEAYDWPGPLLSDNPALGVEPFGCPLQYQWTVGSYTHDARDVRFTANCSDSWTGDDPGLAKTYTVTVTADLHATCLAANGCADVGGSVYRPDGRVRAGTSGAWIGNDSYQTAATTQVAKAAAKRGRTATISVSVQNDGTAADRITVRASGAQVSGYTVRYYHGATDITSAVTKGTFRTPRLAPGKTYLITAKIKVANSARAGSKVKRVLTLKSVGDGVTRDVVGLQVRRT